MASVSHGGEHSASRGAARGGRSATRLSTETKASFKTTEFWAFLAVLAGILVSAAVIDSDGGTDRFIASDAWLYAAIVTVGYLVSRGLAKSGVRDPYWAERGDRDADH